MTVHPNPRHDTVCDALGCGVRCPIAAMRDALRAVAPLIHTATCERKHHAVVCANVTSALAAAEGKVE